MQLQIRVLLITLLLAGCVSTGPTPVGSTVNVSGNADADSIECTLEGEQIAVKGHTYSLAEFTLLGVANVAGAACIVNDCLDGYEPLHPEDADYLNVTSKAPHEVTGEYSEGETVLSLDHGLTFNASEVEVVSFDHINAWLKSSENDELVNVYGGPGVTLKGDLTVLAGDGPPSRVRVTREGVFLASPVIKASEIEILGDFTVSEDGSPEESKSSFTVSDEVRVVRGWVKVSPEQVFPLQSDSMSLTGSVDLEGVDVKGNLRLRGDLTITKDSVEGEVTQLFKDGEPKLRAEIEVTPEKLCFASTQGSEYSTEVRIREVSGVADAEDVKVYLLTESEYLSITTGNIFGDLFQAFISGVERYGNLEPNGGTQAFLQVETAGTEQKGVLYVRCDNCTPKTIPIVIQPK